MSKKRQKPDNYHIYVVYHHGKGVNLSKLGRNFVFWGEISIISSIALKISFIIRRQKRPFNVHFVSLSVIHRNIFVVCGKKSFVNRNCISSYKNKDYISIVINFIDWMGRNCATTGNLLILDECFDNGFIHICQKLLD